jgi:nucleoid-associated protein YgaU
MRRGRSWLALWALLLGDTGALAALWPLAPHPVRLAGTLAHPQQWVAGVGPDRAVMVLAGGGLWLALAWLGTGLGAAVAANLPGALGRVARRLAAALLPRACYRLVAGAAGLGVLLVPVAAGASAAASNNAAPASPAVSAPQLPASPQAAPVLPAAAHRAHPAAGATVTVRPGDSLWRIAAAHLPRPAGPASIAAAWPRWYAANRRTIGADPDLLLPGQLLHAPEEDR